MVPSLPSCPLEVCSGEGEGTAPSAAQRLRATAGAGLCVINPGANPPAGAARQIKELTHLCLRAAAEGSCEESRAGLGESRGAACVLLIDKEGRASSSETSPAPSKCSSRTRRGKKKALLSLAEPATVQLFAAGEGVRAPGQGWGERAPLGPGALQGLPRQGEGFQERPEGEVSPGLSSSYSSRRKKGESSTPQTCAEPGYPKPALTQHIPNLP